MTFATHSNYHKLLDSVDKGHMIWYDSYRSSENLEKVAFEELKVFGIKYNPEGKGPILRVSLKLSWEGL